MLLPVLLLLPPLQEARPPMMMVLATSGHMHLTNWWKARVE
jgi:hypothetical protein